MLALKMLLRSWRGGQLGLIFSALVLAVAVVTSVSLLAERVELALVKESSSFLAADLVVSSSKPIDSEWLQRAQQDGVRTAQIASFASMAYAADEMHLASLKAVESSYPLRGAVKRSSVPFATDELDIETVVASPQPGELWVDSRLLPLLDIQLGDSIEVGDGSFKVSQILIEEPDSGSSFSVFGARILMNWADLPVSGVIQPGSRVTYRLLIAASEGEKDNFDNYVDWLKEQLDVHDRIITPDEAQASIASTMDKGRRFLLLAGSIGVVLAGIALALASHHFANAQLLQVALFKSWGISVTQVRELYFKQIVLLGIAGSAVGLFIGWGFHQLLITAVREWLPISLPVAGSRPWITGFATGLLCLIGFTLPALWHLPAQSPLAVLRRETQAKSLNSLIRGSIGVLSVAVLLFWYSGNFYLSMAILLGFAITAGASIAVGLVLLRLGKTYGHWMGSIWRLALSNLWRRKKPSLIQMVGFSGAIALLMIMLVVRTSLIDEWRWQLADDAPNHFLVNVAGYELDGVKSLVNQRQLETAGWYSMVRGRITHLNNQLPDAVLKEGHESLRRELNLSWTSDLPEGNKIVQGQWWDSGALPTQGLAPVSLEDDVARELGLVLGDTIRFSVGGLTFDAVITSTRSLNWDSMTPNFYFLFPEGYLEDYPRTHMTSLYIPGEEKLLVNDLLRKYPTVQIIELDKIIDRIRIIVSQVTRGLEMMTLLILGCGILVMFSAVSLSMHERLQESAILRTLGSSRRLILGVQWVEFSTLGIMAGLLAALGAEFAIAMLQRFMFSLPFSWHSWLWGAGPVGGGLLVGLLGVSYSRKAVTQPPLQVLNNL
jgi:putative ABC transport system permease protein